MYPLFNVQKKSNVVKIVKKSKLPIINIYIFFDHYYVGCMSQVSELKLDFPKWKPKSLIIYVDLYKNGQYIRMSEKHPLYSYIMSRDQKYKPGDILVGCDNVNGLPYGYMGHAAIVVDSEHIVEATPLPPIIRKKLITSFKSNHPTHIQIRPRSSEMGEKAAKYALNYVARFNENKEKEKSNPMFYFTLQKPLTDEETYIYCSKLVWLSYYFGADYKIENDHLWFAPEDLSSSLMNNPDFEIVYKHSDFDFHINL